MHRRKFLTYSSTLLLTPIFLDSNNFLPDSDFIQTIEGKLELSKTGLILSHEHVLVDFIGADKFNRARYDQNEAFAKILPFLMEANKIGYSTFMECTPQYLGRDIELLMRLAKASGLNIVTNTGLYGSQNGKFLPPYVYTETSREIADRWIKEWENGIEGTGIKPGFIKISVDKAPIKDFQRKLIEAAAIAHLSTGLSIASHTGEAPAALEQIEILRANGVHPSAFIWVHAQSEKNPDMHLQIAQLGAWPSYDGIGWGNPEEYLRLLLFAKENLFLNQVLISHDAGWYRVGEPNGGEYKGYTTIHNMLLPLLQNNVFTKEEINKLLVTNPGNAYQIKKRFFKPDN